MDTINLGSDRESRRWRPGWWPRPGRPGRRPWLAVLGAAVAAVAVLVLVMTQGHSRGAVRGPLTHMFAGVPASSAHTELFVGGASLWRLDRQPRAINGLSALLTSGQPDLVAQLVPVPGGVVALMGVESIGITHGALGRVVFIPSAANARPRAIARATGIAVAPGRPQVWVQTAIQHVHSRQGVPANVASPTWAVNLAGRRVSPVLHLPLGLVAATESGPLTQNLHSGQLRLWNGATGRPIHLPLPAAASFVAAGSDRVVWASYGPVSQLHVTDLRTGRDIAVELPRTWRPVSQTRPPPSASFDPTGQRLVLPLVRVNGGGNNTAEDLFVADTAARTVRAIPVKPFTLSASRAIPLVGAWDQKGLLWVLATNPDRGYYQLASWTGTGPLHTLAPRRDSPIMMSAPGPG